MYNLSWNGRNKRFKVFDVLCFQIERMKKLEELRNQLSLADKEAETGNSVLAHSEIEIANCKEQTKIVSKEIVCLLIELHHRTLL